MDPFTGDRESRLGGRSGTTVGRPKASSRQTRANDCHRAPSCRFDEAGPILYGSKKARSHSGRKSFFLPLDPSYSRHARFQ
jgi:hypothetical protein